MLYAVIKNVLSIYYRLIYFATYEGVQNVPDEGGALICGNHKHFNDPLVTISFMKRQPAFLGKAELFKNKLLAAVLKHFGCVPVDRSGGDLKALRTGIKLLKEDNLILMYPEGTRYCKHIDEVKPGAIMFAIKAQVPIIPVGVSRLRPFGRTKVRYGKPIYYTDYYDKKLNSKDYNRLVAELMLEIFNLVDEECCYFDEIKACVADEH